MKKNIKTRMLGIGLVAGTMLTFVASISSTIAWYAYSTRVNVEFEGTSVRQTEQLQVGIKTDYVFSPEMEKYKVEYVDKEGEKYAFIGAGLPMGADFIREYLEKAPVPAGVEHRYNELYPVTSQKYEEGDELHLKRSLNCGYKVNTEDAHEDEYIHIPFAFRVVKAENKGSQIFEKNKNIWLSAGAVETPEGEEVDHAVRVFFENGSRRTLYCPAHKDESAPKFTRMGGLLDLDGDGYYDLSAETGLFDVNPTELIYGNYDESSIPEPTGPYSVDTPEDVNGVKTGEEELEFSTFYAMHRKTNKGFTKSLLDSVDFDHANFMSLEDMKPHMNPVTRAFEGGQILTTTSNDSYGIADLDATIYMEGWDHLIINKAIGSKFNLGLTFEIDSI